MTNRTFVGIPHINNNCVLACHHFVILVSFQMMCMRMIQRGRIGSTKSVSHQLIRLSDIYVGHDSLSMTRYFLREIALSFVNLLFLNL